MKQVQASNNYCHPLLYMQLTLFLFSYKPLDICSEMVKVAEVLNLNMSNCPVLILCEDLVSVIGMETTFAVRSKMKSAIDHIAIHQFSMDFGSSSFNFPCLVASVDLPSSY